MRKGRRERSCKQILRCFFYCLLRFNYRDKSPLSKLILNIFHYLCAKGFSQLKNSNHKCGHISLASICRMLHDDAFHIFRSAFERFIGKSTSRIYRHCLWFYRISSLDVNCFENSAIIFHSYFTSITCSREVFQIKILKVFHVQSH